MFNARDGIKKLYSSVCGMLFGIKKNQVLFISFSGNSYSDNPRAISEALHDIDTTVQICWALYRPDEKRGLVPDYVKIIDRGSSLQYYKTLATSKVFVDNFSFLESKRKGQRFIQTWHGDRAFKKVLYDATPVRKRELSESVDGFCDLMVAGSDYGIKQLRSAFHYNGEILAVGTPRDDILLNADPTVIEKIKKGLKLPTDKKILLYAPTFREKYRHGQGNQEIQDLEIERTLSRLESKDHTQWICLMRAHPNMTGLSGFENNEQVLDVSGYEDISELLLISDMLITDYSSCAGDFALTRKPIVLYQSDRSQYMAQDRTFYFNMEDSPYWIAENQEELESMIDRITPDSAKTNCEQILDFYGTYESGKSAAAVANRILEWMKE